MSIAYRNSNYNHTVASTCRFEKNRPFEAKGPVDTIRTWARTKLAVQRYPNFEPPGFPIVLIIASELLAMWGLLDLRNLDHVILVV